MSQNYGDIPHNATKPVVNSSHPTTVEDGPCNEDQINSNHVESANNTKLVNGSVGVAADSSTIDHVVTKDSSGVLLPKLVPLNKHSTSPKQTVTSSNGSPHKEHNSKDKHNGSSSKHHSSSHDGKVHSSSKSHSNSGSSKVKHRSGHHSSSSSSKSHHKHSSKSSHHRSQDKNDHHHHNSSSSKSSIEKHSSSDKSSKHHRSSSSSKHHSHHKSGHKGSSSSSSSSKHHHGDDKHRKHSDHHKSNSHHKSSHDDHKRSSDHHKSPTHKSHHKSSSSLKKASDSKISFMNAFDSSGGSNMKGVSAIPPPHATPSSKDSTSPKVTSMAANKPPLSNVENNIQELSKKPKINTANLKSVGKDKNNLIKKEAVKRKLKLTDTPKKKLKPSLKQANKETPNKGIFYDFPVSYRNKHGFETPILNFGQMKNV